MTAPRLADQGFMTPYPCDASAALAVAVRLEITETPCNHVIITRSHKNATPSQRTWLFCARSVPQNLIHDEGVFCSAEELAPICCKFPFYLGRSSTWKMNHFLPQKRELAKQICRGYEMQMWDTRTRSIRRKLSCDAFYLHYLAHFGPTSGWSNISCSILVGAQVYSPRSHTATLSLAS